MEPIYIERTHLPDAPDELAIVRSAFRGEPRLLHPAPGPELKKKLRAIAGVRPWTAEYVAIARL